MKFVTEALQFAGRQPRLVRLGLYAAFGFCVFFIALYASIPRDRLRERLERELSQDPSPSAPMGLGLDVTIGDLGLSLISPGLRASEVTLKQRPLPGAPLPAGRKPATYFIDSFEAHVPLFDLLIGRKAVKVDMSAFSGEAQVEAGLGGDDAFAKAEGKHLAIALLPGVAQAAPIPVGGDLDFNIDLKVPLDKHSQRPQIGGAAGLVEFTIEDAVLGNGKAKLVVPGDPFLAQGVTVPRLRLGRVNGKLVVDKGRATLAELHTKSPDGEVSLEGYIELRDPFPFSELHLYLRFRPSPELLKREAMLELMVNTMTQAKRADGSLGIAITGTAASPLARPSKEPPGGVTSHGAAGSPPATSHPSNFPSSFPPRPAAAVTPPPPPPPVPTRPPPPPPVAEPTPPTPLPPVIDNSVGANQTVHMIAPGSITGAYDPNAAAGPRGSPSPSVRMPPSAGSPSVGIPPSPSVGIPPSAVPVPSDPAAPAPAPPPEGDTPQAPPPQN